MPAEFTQEGKNREVVEALSIMGLDWYNVARDLRHLFTPQARPLPRDVMRENTGSGAGEKEGCEGGRGGSVGACQGRKRGRGERESEKERKRRRRRW